MVRRSGFVAVVLAIFALLVFQVSPVFAHGKSEENRGKGKARAAEAQAERGGSSSSAKGSASSKKDSGSSSGWTEDNDTNDNDTPNNVADEGDNAHPSGKDKSVEAGGSGNQGNSASHPDDSKGPMRYEGELGADKPNGPGGTDLADQDGNNGCGNDDDFDDDNNGWCGKPTETETETETQSEVEEEVLGSGEKTCPATEVMGSQDSCEEVAAEEVAAETDEVKGVRHFAVPAVRAATAVAGATAPAVAVAGAVLPFTGAGLIPFAALGMALVGAGGALLARKR